MYTAYLRLYEITNIITSQSYIFVQPTAGWVKTVVKTEAILNMKWVATYKALLINTNSLWIETIYISETTRAENESSQK